MSGNQPRLGHCSLSLFTMSHPHSLDSTFLNLKLKKDAYYYGNHSEYETLQTLADAEAFGALLLELLRLCETITVGDPGPLAAASDATLEAPFSDDS